MKKHILYFDALRVIACLAVVLIHCCGGLIGSSAAYEIPSGFLYNVAYSLDILSRFAVPVFIMISGAIFLSEEYDYKKEKIKKHIVKLIKLFVFWTIIYCIAFYVITPILKHESISIIACLKSLVGGAYHMWYIYLLIGLYLITPLLRLWVNKKNIKYVRYFLILSIIMMSFIPTLLSFLGAFTPIASDVMKQYNAIIPGYIGGQVVFYILGWHINNTASKKADKIYIGVGLAGIILTIATAILMKSNGLNTEWLYRTLSLHVVFYALSIFMIGKKYFDKKELSENKIIKGISTNSLGVYIAHPLMLLIFNSLFVGVLKLPIEFYLPCCFIFVFMTTYTLVAIMKKIPIIKEFA